MTENQKRRIEDRLPAEKLDWTEPLDASLTEEDAKLLDAAEEYAESYDGDDRLCIKADVINAFCAGHTFATKVLPAAQSSSAGAARQGGNTSDKESPALAQAGARAEPVAPAQTAPKLTPARYVELWIAHGLPFSPDWAYRDKVFDFARAIESEAAAAPTTPAQVPAAEVRAQALDEHTRFTIKQAADALAYVAYNYDGSKLEDLKPGVVESTGVSETALIAERNLRELLSTADKASEVRANDSRYPYTYAADYLRMQIGDDYGKGLISRSAASQARTLVAKAIGLPDAHVANKLADAYLAADSGNTVEKGGDK